MREKPKANSLITTELVSSDADGEVLVFKVRDTGEARLPLLLLSDKNRHRAMLHGLVQKVSDAAALSRVIDAQGKETNATPENKLAAMQKVVDHFASGSDEWNLKREGGGGPSAETQLLIKALCELYPGKPAEEIAKRVKSWSVSDRNAMLVVEGPVKVIVDRLRLESAKSVDTTSLLAGLDEVV